MPLDRLDIKAALLKKGFRISDKNQDHDYFVYENAGVITPIFTKVSRGSSYKTISDSLVSSMAKQIKLSNGEFKSLVDCELDAKGYKTILLNRNIIEDTTEKEVSHGITTFSSDDLVEHSKYLETHCLYPKYVDGQPNWLLVPLEAFQNPSPEKDWPCYYIDTKEITPVTLSNEEIGITL